MRGTGRNANGHSAETAEKNCKLIFFKRNRRSDMLKLFNEETGYLIIDELAMERESYKK